MKKSAFNDSELVNSFAMGVITCNDSLCIIDYSNSLRVFGVRVRRGASLTHYFGQRSINALKNLKDGDATYIEYTCGTVQVFAAVRSGEMYVLFLATLNRIIEHCCISLGYDSNYVLNYCKRIVNSEKCDLDAVTVLNARRARQSGVMCMTLSRLKTAFDLATLRRTDRFDISGAIERTMRLITEVNGVSAEWIRFESSVRNTYYSDCSAFDVGIVYGGILMYAIKYSTDRPIMIHLDEGTDSVCVLVTVMQSLSERQLENQRRSVMFEPESIESAEYFTIFLIERLCSLLGWKLTRAVTEVGGNQQLFLRIPAQKGELSFRSVDSTDVETKILDYAVNTILGGTKLHENV